MLFPGLRSHKKPLQAGHLLISSPSLSVSINKTSLIVTQRIQSWLKKRVNSTWLCGCQANIPINCRLYHFGSGHPKSAVTFPSSILYIRQETSCLDCLDVKCEKPTYRTSNCMHLPFVFVHYVSLVSHGFTMSVRLGQENYHEFMFEVYPKVFISSYLRFSYGF